MRIAILNWRDLAHPDSGGAEVFVHEVATRWAASGHEVTLCSSRPRGLAERSDNGRVRIIRGGSLKTGSHHLRAPRYSAAARPDVVLESINTIPYFLPCRHRGFPPFVTLVHQLAVDVWRSHLPRPAAAVARWIEPHFYRPYRKVPVVAVSESTRGDLLRLGVRDVTVIPQGGLGEQKQLPKESIPTFVYVGRLSPNKRPDHVVAAFRHIKQTLPDARLWLIGEGEMKASLQKNLPPGVTLLGRLPRGDLLDRLSRAHALLVTSVREGWGLVVTEANALGTPAVAYDVPGLRDSVKSGVTGLLTQVSPGALAEAATGLVRDEELYERLRGEALTWGSSCTWDKTAAALLERLLAVGRLAPSIAT